MFRDIERVLIDQGVIAARVRALGQEIAEDLARDQRRRRENGTDPGRVVLVPVLTGAMVFGADLIRQMPLKMSIDVVAVSSYPGRSVASKGASIRGELPQNLGGTHVLVVDDILDSGQTLAVVRSLICEQEPASIRLCVLLEKKKPGEPSLVKPEYVGFEIPDEFVVGYGLDYNGFYRNYPDIAVLKHEAM